tara:strand:+ start:299 stop:1141 length:843 start_codon:yes stop_codon:yes gene_type:complete
MHGDLIKHCPEASQLLSNYDGSAEAANDIFQCCFLRQANQQRWELKDTYAYKREELFPYFAELGMTETVYPSSTEYDVIFIHGTTVPVMRIYFNFLQEIWAQGVRAKSIVLLTGRRKLDPVRDSDALMFDEQVAGVPFRIDWERPEEPPAYESDAMIMIWDQMILDDTLHALTPTLIDAPQICDVKHKTCKRPNTRSTVTTWLENNPKPGKYLAISGNPFINYQDATMRIELEEAGLFDEGATLETVGPARPSITSTGIYLDNLARWIYTVYQHTLSNND